MLIDARGEGIVSLSRKADLNLFSKDAGPIDSAIEELIDRTKATGGASVSLMGADIPATGYMVGGYVDSLIFGQDMLIHGDAAMRAILQFVSEHAALVTKKSMYLGSWIDQESGMVYIDISQRFENLDDALFMAKFNEELAIWDLTNEKEIRCSM